MPDIKLADAPVNVPASSVPDTHLSAPESTHQGAPHAVDNESYAALVDAARAAGVVVGTQGELGAVAGQDPEAVAVIPRVEPPVHSEASHAASEGPAGAPRPESGASNSPAAPEVKSAASDPAQEAAHVELVRSHVDGIKGLIPNNADGAKDKQLRLQIQLRVQKAQLAGVTADELQVALSDALAPEKVVRVTTDGRTVEQKTREIILRPEQIGLGGEQASQEDLLRQKRETVAQIIKLNTESKPPKQLGDILPESDVRDAAEAIVSEKLQQKSNKPKDVKRAQELRDIMVHRSPEELALIIASQERFPTRENLEAADLVDRKVQYTKGWRKLSPEGKAQRRADEQFAALVANQAQLKELMDRYKNLEPWWITAIKFLFGISLATAFDLIQDEVGNTMEGRSVQ